MRAALGRSAGARAWAIGPLAWAIGPLAELDGALRPGRAAGARCCSAGRGPGRSGRWPSLIARCDRAARRVRAAVLPAAGLGDRAAGRA